MNYSITKADYKNLMTAMAKQNSLDEQIDYVKSKLTGAKAKSIQLSAFKKELTVLRKIKRIRQR